mmetsp:Transcript_98404/g.300920  ORF Transcript_98404/g.300920 Transcript_98404/m.300920 type:complete len:335 (-) Transcript_98404:3270-4274(-)
MEGRAAHDRRRLHHLQSAAVAAQDVDDGAPRQGHALFDSQVQPRGDIAVQRRLRRGRDELALGTVARDALGNQAHDAKSEDACLATGQQASDGRRAGQLAGHRQVHQARHVHGEGSRHEHPHVAARLGRPVADPRHHQAQGAVDREADIFQALAGELGLEEGRRDRVEEQEGRSRFCCERLQSRHPERRTAVRHRLQEDDRRQQRLVAALGVARQRAGDLQERVVLLAEDGQPVADAQRFLVRRGGHYRQRRDAPQRGEDVEDGEGRGAEDSQRCSAWQAGDAAREDHVPVLRGQGQPAPERRPRRRGQHRLQFLGREEQHHLHGERREQRLPD